MEVKVIGGSCGSHGPYTFFKGILVTNVIVNVIDDSATLTGDKSDSPDSESNIEQSPIKEIPIKDPIKQSPFKQMKQSLLKQSPIKQSSRKSAYNLHCQGDDIIETEIVVECKKEPPKLEMKTIVLAVGDFVPVRPWSASAIKALAEIRKIWKDKNEPALLTELRLYFHPESTEKKDEKRFGEHEVLAIADKVVIRTNDFVTWLDFESKWKIGLQASVSMNLSKPYKVLSLKSSQIDFSEVDEAKALHMTSKFAVISYARYCRFRSTLKRLENVTDEWLRNMLVMALGGFVASGPDTKIMFCRETFDYPELEAHEQLCNHLAPKLKGRPRGRRKKVSTDSTDSRLRGDSPYSESAGSEISACSVEKVYSKYSPLYVKPEFKQGIHVLASRPQLRYNPRPSRTKCKSESDEASPAPSSILKPVAKENRKEIKTEPVEQAENSMSAKVHFMEKLLKFHEEHKSNIPRSFWVGLRKVNLQAVYERVQKLGGYYECTEKKLWKYLFGTNSTSSNSLTRKKYERGLLPYENYLKNLNNLETANGGNTSRVLKLNLEDKDFMEIKKECLSNDKKDKEKSDSMTDRLTVAEMSEIQRKVKEKDLEQEDESAVSVPVTVIVGGQSVECHPTSPQKINLQQPHTTITVHQTTIHPQSINSPSKQCQNRSITNLIQIQQITVQPNAGRNGETGQYTCNIKQDKNGQEVQIESNGEPAKICRRLSSIEESTGRDGYSPNSKAGAGKTSSLRHVRVKQDRSKDRSKPITVSQPGAQPYEKENIPYWTGSKTTTITPILGNSNKDPRIQSPEVIDLLDSDNDSSSSGIPSAQATSQSQVSSNIFPNMKKRKLEILREGGLEVTAISNTGGLLGPNYFGPQTNLPPPVTEEKPALRPEIVGSIPSVSGVVSPDSCTKAPTPKFQSNCMYMGTCKVFDDPKDSIPPYQPTTEKGMDLTVKRLERRKSVEIFRLPVNPPNNSVNESETKAKADSSLLITLVPPMTHVQIIHNSQNHNIKRKSSDTSNYGSAPPKKRTTEANHRSTPSTSSRSSLNIPSFPASDMKINPFILQQLMSQFPQTRNKPSASITSQQHASRSQTSSQKSSQPKMQQPPIPLPPPLLTHHLQTPSQQPMAPNPFIPILDPLYFSALYSNPNFFFQPSNFPHELLQLYKNLPLGMGKVPVSKS